MILLPSVYTSVIRNENPKLSRVESHKKRKVILFLETERFSHHCKFSITTKYSASAFRCESIRLNRKISLKYHWLFVYWQQKCKQEMEHIYGCLLDRIHGMQRETCIIIQNNYVSLMTLLQCSCIILALSFFTASIFPCVYSTPRYATFVPI